MPRALIEAKEISSVPIAHVSYSCGQSKTELGTDRDGAADSRV